MTIPTLVFALLATAIGADAIIPKKCANSADLMAKECCPEPEAGGGRCGSRMQPVRGNCSEVQTAYGKDSQDIRRNWPRRLFDRVCKCTDNFGGYDCGDCKFGYIYNSTNNTCERQKENRERKSLKVLTDYDEWTEYRNTLDKAKNTVSTRYMVVDESYREMGLENALVVNISNTSYTLKPITVYDLFIWIHHFAAKDNENKSLDFAHEATGFLTWHRLFLLWFEREIQIELSKPDFTLYYWDWSNENEREESSGKLSLTAEPFRNWETICWRPKSVFSGDFITICNPEEKTMPLRRCPNPDVCKSDSGYWPTKTDVQRAIANDMYDGDDYKKVVDPESARSFLEGFEVVKSCDKQTVYCTTSDGKNIARKLHNTVHLILGNGESIDEFESTPEKKGVMGDVAASPNDPIFINHHTMIDCIFEKWLQCHKNATYPVPSNPSDIPEGHKKKDYQVPFLPLYTHEEMFKQASDFGYTCNLDNYQCSNTSGALAYTFTTLVVLLSVIAAVFQ